MKSPLVGPAFRVGSALLLCAACFQAGRWYQELSGPVAARAKAKDPGNEMVSSTYHGAPEPAAKTVEPTPLVSAGDPVGQTSDIITPLNVRDPSALVMGPMSEAPVCPPPAATPAPLAPLEFPKGKAVGPLKLGPGRLLELLKKADKKSELPKTF